MEPDAPLVEALAALCKAALLEIQTARLGLDRFRGSIAFYNPMNDDHFTKLSSFSTATEQLERLSFVQQMYGTGAADRLVLQFLYEFLSQLEETTYHQEVFREAFSTFWTELEEPEWRFYGLANVQNFASQSYLLDLGDGISIRGRFPEKLKQDLGWSDSHLQALMEDWTLGQSASSHVVLIEERIAKSPENIVLSNGPSIEGKARMILLAMRLTKPGSVRFGRLFAARPSRLVPHGGISSSGFTFAAPGTHYQLNEQDCAAITATYQDLLQVDARLRGEASNVAVALRAFTSMNERLRYQHNDEIIDAVTALEALFKIDRELAFRSAYLGASLLASSDNERSETFDMIRKYYGLRNDIVHGSQLKPKDLTLVEQNEPLREILRRLLRGFIHLLKTYPVPFNQFYNDLDSQLLRAAGREKLRVAMGMA